MLCKKNPHIRAANNYLNMVLLALQFWFKDCLSKRFTLSIPAVLSPKQRFFNFQGLEIILINGKVYIDHRHTYCLFLFIQFLFRFRMRIPKNFDTKKLRKISYNILTCYRNRCSNSRNGLFFQKQPPQVFCEILQNSQVNNCARVSFLIGLQLY